MRKIILTLVVLSLIILSGCAKTQSIEDPQLVAERFARFYEQKDWNSMYDLFTPELQKKETKQQFYELAEYKNKDIIIVVRLDKVSKDNEEVSYAYYSGSLGALELKMPAAKMVLTDNKWKFDAFASYFYPEEMVKECVTNDCIIKMVSIFKVKEWCDKVDYNLKEECMGKIGVTLSKEEKLKLCDESSNKAECIYNLAIETSDSDMCKLISLSEDNYETIKQCYAHFGLLTKSKKTDLCGINGGENCFIELAKEYNDLTLCSRTGALIWRCYGEVSASLKNVTICSDLSTQEQKDLCVLRYNKITKDSKVCDLIVAELFSKDCI